MTYYARRRSAGAALLGVAAVLFVAGLVVAPWLLMLAVGNFGFGQFGFIDCLPAGLLVAGLRASASSSSS